MVKLLNKVVIVTGASSGIGKESAKVFAAKGARVILVARRIELLEELKDEIRSEGGDSIVYSVDVSDDKSIQDMISKTVKTYGQIDILLNNAGYGMESSIVSPSMDDIKQIFDVNVFGYFRSARAVIPVMIDQGMGHIINVSSMIVQFPTPFMSYYAATKSAIAAWSRAMRMELEPLGIAVTEVYPGITKTEFAESAESHLRKDRSTIYTFPAQSARSVARSIVSAAEEKKEVVFPFLAGAS